MSKTRLMILAVLVSASAFAGGLRLRPDALTDLSNCAADGSTASTLVPGEYLMTSKDAAANLCFAATCASAGQYFPADSMVHIEVKVSTSVSCRSSGANADFQFARVN